MPTQDILVSQKFNNYNYAPGIATYGIDGKTGEPGINGNNIFFTDFNLKNRDGIKGLQIQIKNNYLPINGENQVISRPYKNGDLFFDITGIIYKLTNLDELVGGTTISDYSKYFKIVGKLELDNGSNIFGWENSRLYLNASWGGYDVITTYADVSSLINEDSVINIISDNIDSNGNIEMVKMQSLDETDIEDGTLSVYYNTQDNAYHLDSNMPIIIDGDLKVNSELSEVDFDEYSTVLTSDDTITYFKHICDQLRYNLVYDSNINKYKIVIYQANRERDLLDYIVNRNETVFGKIYTQNDEQVLMKLSNVVIGNIDSSKYYDNYISDHIFSDDDIRISKSTFTMYNASIYQYTVNDSSIYYNKVIDTETNMVSIDISLAELKKPESENTYNSMLLNKVFAVNVYQRTPINYYKFDDQQNIVGSGANTDKVNLKLFRDKNNTYEFTFNTYDFGQLEKTITMEIFPQIDYIGQPPIKVDFYIGNIIGEYTLYFEIERSEKQFSIKNIMLSDKRHLVENHYDEEAPCIETIVPDKVDSVYRFSLLHNTEVFLNYEETSDFQVE